MDKVEALITNDPQLTYGTATTQLLTEGYVANACDTCCPDCTQTQRYFLGGFESWDLYASVVYNVQTCPPPCCVNKSTSLASLTLFNTLNQTTGTPPGGCCDNFSSCYNQLIAFTGTPALNLLEESSFRDSSGLCALYQWFVDNAITGVDARLAIESILTSGLVIHCLEDGSCNYS